jgi:hypothetical protein
MTTYIALEDGRVLGTSNGVFDAILEAAVEHMVGSGDRLDGLREWLLKQRCEVQGPGVGYLDLRELPPRAASELKTACIAAHGAMKNRESPAGWLPDLTLLLEMWSSLERGEPPEALTSPNWEILPFSGMGKIPAGERDENRSLARSSAARLRAP